MPTEDSILFVGVVDLRNVEKHSQHLHSSMCFGVEEGEQSKSPERSEHVYKHDRFQYFSLFLINLSMFDKIINFFLQNVLPNEAELQHIAINHVRKYFVED